MKRLRLKCPFCGYGTIVAWITLFISSFAGAFFGLIYADRANSIGAAFISTVITALLTLTASLLWLNRTTDEEKARIQTADAPVWRKPSRQEKSLASATMVVLHFEFIIIFAIVILTLFALIASSDFKITPLFIIIISAVFLFIATIYIWHILRDRIWRSMDDTAVCTVLSVSSVYIVKSSSRSNWSVTNYAVIYTNEGKLILPAKTVNISRSEAKKYRPEKIERICIVKYKGMITYFPIMPHKLAITPRSYRDAEKS